MAGPRIKYKDRYKYQLTEEYQVKVKILPDADVPAENPDESYLVLKTDGTLIIRKGYAWDGPSGPSIDTPDFMRGSLVHDALYQLMRKGHLDREKHRKAADEELRRMCREDGMWTVRSNWVYWAVRNFAEKAASEDAQKPVITAP